LHLKGLKNIIVLGAGLVMISGCAWTTNPYSDDWGDRHIPTPKFSRKTVYGSLIEGLQGKKEGSLIFTMHPENLDDMRMYTLNLNKESSGKCLDELIIDTYNNVVMGAVTNEIIKIIPIREKGYKKHPSPPFMEKKGTFTNTKKPYPKYITEARYVAHILSMNAIQDNKRENIFDPENMRNELYNNARHYDHAWMGYGTMIFQKNGNKLGTVMHEIGGETTFGSTRGCVALDKEGMLYFLKHTKIGATIRFIYDPVVEYVSTDGQLEIIKMGLKDTFKIFKKNFPEYIQQNEEADLRNISQFLEK
jgi:hypothetical protein